MVDGKAIYAVRNSLTKKLLEMEKGTVSGLFAKRRLASLIKQSDFRKDKKVESFCKRASPFLHKEERELLAGVRSTSSQDADLEKLSHLITALSIQMNRKDLLRDLDKEALGEVATELRSELVKEKSSKAFIWNAFGHAFSVLQGGYSFEKNSIKRIYQKDKYELLALLEEMCGK